MDKSTKKHKKWTAEEYFLLKQQYLNTNKSVKEIARLLGRTQDAIRAKISMLKISRFNIEYILNNKIIKNSGVFGENDTYGSECWIWIGYIADNGYGELEYCGKRDRAHRFVYECLTKQVIPEKLTIDHLCRRRDCVNPEHMEIVTRGENVLRGNSTSGINARKTECIHHHPFDENNTAIHKDGFRHCKECRKLRERERRRKKKYG